MFVPLLKTCCQMCILHYVIGDDYDNRLYLSAKEFLTIQLDDGAWGVESLAILDRAIKHVQYSLTPRVILSLLPNLTKILSLRECSSSAVDDECLDTALKRCEHLQSLDITETSLGILNVDLFCAVNTRPYASLSCAILEDCVHVNDSHVQILLRNAPNLQHLNIAGCSITDHVFLLEEETQLAKEACLELDKRFMKGSHLTYNCLLQSVDVSRCSNFTSTGVRHMCTLCGPTLRSVNVAWTKVECTAFLYLSGMGCPSAVKFFMSNGMSDDAMEPLIQQLNQFDSICRDIVNKFTDNDQSTRDDSVTVEEDRLTPFGGRADGDASVDNVTSFFNQPTAIVTCANNDVDLDDILANFSLDKAPPEFEILCLDDYSKSSQLHFERKNISGEASVRNSNVAADCNIVNHSPSLIQGDAYYEKSLDSLHKTFGDGQSCNHLSVHDKHDEQETQRRSLQVSNLNLLSTRCQAEGSKQHDHPSFHENNRPSSCDKFENKEDLELIDLEETGEKLSKSFKTDVMKTFFTPNITNVSFNAAVFRDDDLGLRCFQKFLTSSSRSLKSMSISNGITGSSLDDSVLDLIGTYAKGLDSLSVQGSDRLTTAGIMELANNCHSLTFLDLTGVSFIGDEAIIPLVDSQPITHLRLAETLITGQLMTHLASLPLAKTLKEIDLSWCEELESNEALNEFISACPRLERLMLRECCVSRETLNCIYQHSHHITELSLASNMSVIQDEGIILLTKNLPVLTIIDLGWNSYLTNPSIIALLSNCRLLERANLEGLKLITSLPFMPIISVPEELSNYLDKRREDISERCVDEMEEDTLKLSDVPCFPHRSTVFCTNLQYVNLTYSDFVEDRQLQQIVTVTKGGLQVLDYYGNKVEPSQTSLESILTEYLDGRGQPG